MTSRRQWPVLALVCLVAACGGEDGTRRDDPQSRSDLPADRRDAELLGREIMELVDRAVDYRGSHRGRPASSLRQLGVDSLTSITARHLLNVNREPVITVQFRKTQGREITSCRGDGHILEESAVNGGRYTLMCTTRSGAQRPVQVGIPE